MRLTDTTAAALAIPAGKTEHFEWDDTLPGFGLRLRRLGDGITRRWYAQYRVGRQQRRESLGDVRKIRIDDARKIARQRFAQVELGTDPAAERSRSLADAAAAKLTVGVVADRYLKARKSELRPATFSAAARYFELHLKPLRATPIGELRRVDIAAVLQTITIENGRVAAARARSNLSALLGWAVGEGLVESNAVIGTNRPDKNAEPRERVLDDRELREVWNTCQDDAFGHVVKLLILTGCRRTEIGDLKWNELDLETGIMSVGAERTKGGRGLKLTLPPAAVEILGNIPHAGDYVFGKRGRRGFNAWSYCFMALNGRITAAGKPLKPWTIHDIRRTVRTGLGRVGVAPHVAERVVGHAPPKLEKIYDRYDYQGEIADALRRWADHVEAIVDNRVDNIVPLARA